MCDRCIWGCASDRLSAHYNMVSALVQHDACYIHAAAFEGRQAASYRYNTAVQQKRSICYLFTVHASSAWKIKILLCPQPGGKISNFSGGSPARQSAGIPSHPIPFLSSPFHPIPFPYLVARDEAVLVVVRKGVEVLLQLLRLHHLLVQGGGQGLPWRRGVCIYIRTNIHEGGHNETDSTTRKSKERRFSPWRGREQGPARRAACNKQKRVRREGGVGRT